MQYLAVLISGSVNKLLVYQWHIRRSHPDIEEEFKIPKSLNGKVPTQLVTQISFSPKTQENMVVTGPNGFSTFLTIQTGADAKLNRSEVAGVKEIAKTANVTSHVWQSDADFVVSCTNNGYIIVSSLTGRGIQQKLHFPKVRFMKLAIHCQGLVAATEDSQFYFFSMAGAPIQFSLITKWSPDFMEVPLTSKLNNRRLY